MEEQEETVKLTLHCVGVILMPEIGPCMIMMQAVSPSGIYCVSLTRETSDLVSPLYEHTLLVTKQLRLTQREDALLALFSQSTHFVVHQRLSCRCRVEAQFKQGELIKRMRSLVGNTFFLDIERSYATIQELDRQRLLTPLFTDTVNMGIRYSYLDCTDKEEAARLKAHLDLYHACTQKRYRTKKSLYENFWLEFNTIHKAVIDAAANQLTLYTKGDLLYNRKDIVVLFKDWKNYRSIASYVIHRATTLDYTYVLHGILKNAPPVLRNKIWLMSCVDRISMYDFCCALFNRLMLKPTPIEWKEDDKIHMHLFLENGILSGHLYTILSLLIGQQPRLSQEKLIQKLKIPVLAQCVILRLDGRALTNSHNNKATVDAVTVAHIYTMYQSFTCPTPLLRTPLDPAVSIDLESNDDDDDNALSPTVKEEKTVVDGESEEEPSTVDVEQLWVSSEKDFSALLRHLYNVRRDDWYPKHLNTTLVTAKSVLFFIAPTPHTLKLERDTAVITDRYLLGKALITAKFHQTHPIHSETWQQDWLNLKEALTPTTVQADEDGQAQQYQFMLFSPLEIMRHEDLACIKIMLFSDFFNTSILRETSDVFFVKRLTYYFATNQNEIKMSVFHQEKCIGSNQFVTIREDAIKETVIVPQCHTLSLGAMRNLLQWFIIHRKTIKRIILIGSPFILPCLPHGQAFLDLVRQLEPQVINRPMYDFEARRRELTTIISKYWRTLKWDTPKQLALLQKQEDSFIKEARLRVLYLVKNESLFVHMLETIQETATLFCLHKDEFTKMQLVNSITGVLTAKLKMRFTVDSTPVDRICQYNCAPIEAAPNMFLITKKTLFSLDTNLFFYLFMSLEKLIVIDSSDLAVKGDLLDALIANIEARKRPNLRYSYLATTL